MMSYFSKMLAVGEHMMCVLSLDAAVWRYRILMLGSSTESASGTLCSVFTFLLSLILHIILPSINLIFSTLFNFTQNYSSFKRTIESQSYRSYIIRFYT